MTLTPSEIEARVKIDRNALDDAIVEQAQVYYTVSYQTTQAISERDAAKAKLDQTCAETALFIRQNPSQFTFRMTESSVSEAVMTHPKVKECNTAYLAAKTEADYWQNTQNTFEMRGRALHDLVTLFVAGYFIKAGEGGSAYLREASRQHYQNQNLNQKSE